MQKKHIIQLIVTLFLVALFGALIYMLGNSEFKEYFSTTTPAGKTEDNIVSIFVILSMVITALALTFFTSDNEPKEA